jgi:hypothetical protein
MYSKMDVVKARTVLALWIGKGVFSRRLVAKDIGIGSAVVRRFLLGKALPKTEQRIGDHVLKLVEGLTDDEQRELELQGLSIVGSAISQAAPRPTQPITIDLSYTRKHNPFGGEEAPEMALPQKSSLLWAYNRSSGKPLDRRAFPITGGKIPREASFCGMAYAAYKTMNVGDSRVVKASGDIKLGTILTSSVRAFNYLKYVFDYEALPDNTGYRFYRVG